MVAKKHAPPVVARTVKEFCKAYSVGHTMAYEEIGSGRLEALKSGRRTLITEEAAQRWLRSLPMFLPAGKTRIGANKGEQRRKRRYQRSSKYRNLHSADVR